MGEDDNELAIRFRSELSQLLAPVCKVMEEARSKGLMLGFNIGVDHLGRQAVLRIDVSRAL